MPGTEFKKLVASLGITYMCDACRATMDWMNELGVDGCRNHFGEIVTQIENNARNYSWARKITVAGAGVLRRMKVNPFNPIPGLVEEAIRRAS